ncbi:MAG: Ig-like domain-containing protein, partial [Thermoanaerobaculia bacterium]
AYVGGSNADPADPNSRPAAATIGRGSTAAANFYVPAGTFHLERQSTLTGSVIAFDAAINREATIVLDSAFNFAPVADAQTVTTSGGAASFNLTGSDVDGDTLTFTLVSGPSIGSLSGLPASDAANPTASVGVTYSGGADGVADQFVFMVDDNKGGTDTAVVDINPSDDPPDPPDLPGILAKDDSLEVIQGATDVPITLVAAAPIAPEPNAIGDLVFSIFTGPDQGGSVTTPVSNAETPVRSADVEYTPLATFTGTETFVFQACEVAAPTNCDQGTVTISVQATAAPDPPVAFDQSVTTAVDGSVTINLVSPENTEGDPEGRSCTQNSDCATGFICDNGSCVPGP